MYPVIPSTNVEENNNYSDDQEDDNLSCPENELINEDNLSNVDSALGPDNDKTLNILEQERNDFWCPPDYLAISICPSVEGQYIYRVFTVKKSDGKDHRP